MNVIKYRYSILLSMCFSVTMALVVVVIINREFKIYDATVAKTSLKIASVHVLCKTREKVVSRSRYAENLKEMHGIKKST